MSEPTLVSHGAPRQGDQGPSEVPEILLEDLLGVAAGERRPIVDVRSPAEFAEDRLPGARLVPLLDDQERAVVGTLFRHRSPEAARRWGTERVRARLAEFTREVSAALGWDGRGSPSAATAGVVLCARGGERSEAVVRHLREQGYPALRLRGGYRAYREAVRRRLVEPRIPGPVTLNGLTGCGKTRILELIAKSHPDRVVDLEGLAGHRSSVFGDIGLSPVSQKRFESDLVSALDGLGGDWTLFEWEARRIGNREIPPGVYDRLRAAPQMELRATVEQRIDHLCSEYVQSDSGRGIRERLPRLERYPAFGPDGVRDLERRLDAGEFREVAARLLEKHYDPRYRHEARPPVATFSLTTFEDTAARILSWLEGSR